MDESTIKDFSANIIHYNYNNGQQWGMGADSFFFEGENLLKYKEDIDNKEKSKGKDFNLINTSFKDLSIIKSWDEPGLENVSFTKNMDKYVANIGDGDMEINSEELKIKIKKYLLKMKTNLIFLLTIFIDIIKKSISREYYCWNKALQMINNLWNQYIYKLV